MQGSDQNTKRTLSDCELKPHTKNKTIENIDMLCQLDLDQSLIEKSINPITDKENLKTESGSFSKVLNTIYEDLVTNNVKF